MKNSTRRKRVLVGCGWALATAVLLIATIVLINWQRIRTTIPVFVDIFAEPEYAAGLNTSDEMLAYLQAHADDVALVSYSVAEDGTAVEDGMQIWHNAETLMPLASTKKILILSAYAKAVADGEIDPETAVSLADWDHFHLPYTNGGSHLAALDNLNIPTDDAGYALDPTTTVTYDQMIYAMIYHSDNAAPDYFLNLLGIESITTIMEEAKLEPQPILPHAGMILTWQNSEQGQLTSDKLDQLTSLPREEYVTYTWETQQKFIDSPWGDSERQWWQSGKNVPNLHRLEMQASNQLDSTGTAQTFAQIMASVVTNNFISPEVSTLMRHYLEWPMTFPTNQAEFLALGTKGGSLPGLLTEATFYIPAGGEFQDQPRVVVLFMRNMPFSAWLRLTQTFAQQEFQREVATNPEFVHVVQSRLVSE